MPGRPMSHCVRVRRRSEMEKTTGNGIGEYGLLKRKKGCVGRRNGVLRLTAHVCQNAVFGFGNRTVES